jgi:hypothetical protein
MKTSAASASRPIMPQTPPTSALGAAPAATAEGGSIPSASGQEARDSFDSSPRPPAHAVADASTPPACVPCRPMTTLEIRLMLKGTEPTRISPQRTAEIAAAFDASDRAGFLNWQPGIPEALLGNFFTGVKLPLDRQEGSTLTAYVFVGRHHLDPNNDPDVYITRETPERRDFVKLSLDGVGTRRSSSERAWHEVHGRYPDAPLTISEQNVWSGYKIGFPD